MYSFRITAVRIETLHFSSGYSCLPSEAAWSRQLPSPVVASGHSRWQVPVSAHQLRRPLDSRETSEDSSIRSRSRNVR